MTASSRYRLLEFACPAAQCPAQNRIHYDPADLPACDHGPMTLQPRPAATPPGPALRYDHGGAP